MTHYHNKMLVLQQVESCTCTTSFAHMLMEKKGKKENLTDKLVLLQLWGEKMTLVSYIFGSLNDDASV